jgi:ubiquinone/menaquinone biosynthesis C-methylase UbiE
MSYRVSQLFLRALVYATLAKRYSLIHHLTTHGQDLQWRRAAAFFIMAEYLPNMPTGKIIGLDLCTGIGLSIKEMARVFDFYGIKYQLTGLDYSQGMLREAKKQVQDSLKENIDFVRGDATDLISRFEPDSFDFVTQVAGVGINNMESTAKGVLEVLKPGGRYFLADVHCPIKKLPGEWFFGKWFSFPEFESVTYRESTVPLVLNRLLGWQDPTPNFYKAMEATCVVKGQGWRFEVLTFHVLQEPWWLGLPIMPVAKLGLRKIKIP